MMPLKNSSGLPGGVNLDINRHAGNEAPTGPVPKPQLQGPFELDSAVVDVFPIPGSKLVSAKEYGRSLWGKAGKIIVELPSGGLERYFLKTAHGTISREMMRGEYESLEAIHAVSPDFVPKPLAWGKYANSETHFLLTQFRDIGQQPPEPVQFAEDLAAMHKSSVSPTGKFGFHVTTCHAKLPQVMYWTDSWTDLYRDQLCHMIEIDEAVHDRWAIFPKVVSELLLVKVIPRLLDPLKPNIKPSLVHGDLWDENSATDTATGKPFVFDTCSFYAHNEYDVGNWRAVRHRLSGKKYVESYKKAFPPSEPQGEWDDRNLLYSLRFDLGCAILIPGDNPQRSIVQENMAILCAKFFPEEFRALEKLYGQTATNSSRMRSSQQEMMKQTNLRAEEIRMGGIQECRGP